MRTANKQVTQRRAPPRVRSGKGALMSVLEFWCNYVPEKPRNQVYPFATSGIFPFVRNGRRIELIREPTIEILAGTRPPGPDLRNAGKKRRPKKKAARMKKGEMAPAVMS
jgi:hypothetical protein